MMERLPPTLAVFSQLQACANTVEDSCDETFQVKAEAGSTATTTAGLVNTPLIETAGSSVNAANTFIADQIYNENKSVSNAFSIGMAYFGLGTWLSPHATKGVSNILDALSFQFGWSSSNLYLQKIPNAVGATVEQSVSGIPSFFNLTEEGKRK
jgi:hypothetical protein